MSFSPFLGASHNSMSINNSQQSHENCQRRTQRGSSFVFVHKSRSSRGSSQKVEKGHFCLILCHSIMQYSGRYALKADLRAHSVKADSLKAD